MLRSVLSVLAGIAVLTVASFAIEAAVNPWLPSSNTWAKAITFAYGFLCVAAGGYSTARVARRLPIQHSVVMGVVQAGLTIGAMLSPVANHASRFQWIATAILSIPAATLGGTLRRVALLERSR